MEHREVTFSDCFLLDVTKCVSGCSSISDGHMHFHTRHIFLFLQSVHEQKFGIQDKLIIMRGLTNPVVINTPFCTPQSLYPSLSQWTKTWWNCSTKSLMFQNIRKWGTSDAVWGWLWSVLVRGVIKELSQEWAHTSPLAYCYLDTHKEEEESRKSHLIVVLEGLLEGRPRVSVTLKKGPRMAIKSTNGSGQKRIIKKEKYPGNIIDNVGSWSKYPANIIVNLGSLSEGNIL